MSLTSLYWCSVSVLAHFTKDMASVRVWLNKSLSLVTWQKVDQCKDRTGDTEEELCSDVETMDKWIDEGQNVVTMTGKEENKGETRMSISVNLHVTKKPEETVKQSIP